MGELKDKARQYAKMFGGAAALSDAAVRGVKADKIRAVLRDAGALEPGRFRVLDVGCASGLILRRLADDAEFGVGIDMDDGGMWKAGDRLAFARADAEHLPFAAETFDVVICNHVYEHTDEPERMLREIARVLRPTGICYFAGPNKYDLVEPHYGLPLLSWLPRPLADRYLRWTGRGAAYTERPRSLSGLRQLVRQFHVTDYTGAIVNDPTRFHATDILAPGSLKQWLAKAVLRAAPFVFPGFVYVLRKRRDAL